MAEVNINLKCDLQHAVKVQYLDGNLFSQDAAANIINIEVTDGGAPATIGGTVSANVIRPDGGTVAVTGGTISGNTVSITLPAACYALVGMITIVVKLSSDSVVTTLAAAVAYVYQSSTDTVVDPGTVVSSIQDLIDAIDTAVASIPADYSSLWTKLAPAFSSSTAYTAGQYVTYNGGLYRFTKAHAAGSWASGDVVAVNLGGEVSGIKSALYANYIDDNRHRMQAVENNNSVKEDVRNNQEEISKIEKNFRYSESNLIANGNELVNGENQLVVSTLKIRTDTTFTMEDVPADAKAVGDIINASLYRNYINDETYRIKASDETKEMKSQIRENNEQIELMERNFVLDGDYLQVNGCQLTADGFDVMVGILKIAKDENVENRLKAIEDKNYDPEKYKTERFWTLYINGDMTGISKEDTVNISFNFPHVHKFGTGTLKWQGNSSLTAPKKNYTFKIKNDSVYIPGWGNKQSKFCLKAYYTDFSKARDVVSAKLWGEVVQDRLSRMERDDRPVYGYKYYNLLIGDDQIVVNNDKNLIAKACEVFQPNSGAVDGYPIMLVINGEYAGLYTFNIPKDKWMMGMGNGEYEAILTSESVCDATLMKAEAVLDGTDWEIEYASDESWISESFNTAIDSVMNCEDAESYETIKDYIDVDNAMDYFIFSLLIGNWDGFGRNYFMSTYDGTKWFHTAYDMDNTFGSWYQGAHISPYMTADKRPLSYLLEGEKSDRLFYCIYTYDHDRLINRYQQLRNGVLSELNVFGKFEDFLSAIPLAAYNEETSIWPMENGTSTGNMNQICMDYMLRAKYMDGQILGN